MSNDLLCVAVAAFVFVRGADAAEIKLLSSNAVKEAFSQLIPQFEKATGHRVAVVWGGTPMRLSSVGADTRRSVLLWYFMTRLSPG